MTQPPLPLPPGWAPPPSPPPRRNVNAIIIGAAAALIVIVIGAGVMVTQARGDSAGGSREACKTEMADRYRSGVEEHLAGQVPPPDEKPPPACLFLSRAELTKIVGEVVAEYLDSPEADAAFEDAMREALESAFPSSGLARLVGRGAGAGQLLEPVCRRGGRRGC